MSRSSRRGPWLPEEDASLLHLVRTQGPNNWVRISQHMQHRSPKQCRERYHQNLKPSLNHEPISAQEGEAIEQLVREMGKRWAEIARRLGNRSDNAVKNWWNGSMNRRKRNTVPSGLTSSKVAGYRTQPIPASAPTRPLHLQKQLAPSRDAYESPYPIPSPFHRLDGPHHTPGVNNGYLLTPELGQSYFRPPPYSPYEQSPRSALHYSSTDGGPRPSRDIELSRPHSWSGVPSSDRPEWQLPPLHRMEAPVLSPAATEASHASSNQQAPSLVSDNQSTCSISPKTIPSPRPGMPAPQAPSMHLWPGKCRRDSTGNEERREDYMSSYSSRPERTTTGVRPATVKSPGQKDARMDVSRLLD